MNQTLMKSGFLASSFATSARASSGEVILMIGGSPISSFARSTIEMSGPATATRGAASVLSEASRMSKFQNGPPMSTTLVTPLASHTLNVAGSLALLRSVSFAYDMTALKSATSGRV